MPAVLIGGDFSLMWMGTGDDLPPESRGSSTPHLMAPTPKTGK
jgi:hypothetical protein